MLNFDDATVGGNPSPPDGGITIIRGGPFIYHGLTFSTQADYAFALVNQDFVYDGDGRNTINTGYVSSPTNNLVTNASTSALTALTISTGGNGVIEVISLFVSQPVEFGQSISISGSVNGANSPGCSRTVTPADGAGTAVQFSACFADAFILTGDTVEDANSLVGIDTLLACAATPVSALTATA